MGRYFVMDCESIGLHGETFAVGYVVVDAAGAEIDSGLLACDPGLARGDDEGRAWVEEHVRIDADDVWCDDPRDVRHEFWSYWMEHKGAGAILFADCAWPVEARFLAACVDDREDRYWQGPYPLHEIASLRLAAGFDPLATVDRRLGELPAHNPLADARQSARLLVEALKSRPTGDEAGRGHDSDLGHFDHPGNHASDAEIDAAAEAVWDSFWAPLVCRPDGSLDVGRVKAELYDYHALMDDASRVYDHVTGGRRVAGLRPRHRRAGLEDEHDRRGGHRRGGCPGEGGRRPGDRRGPRVAGRSAVTVARRVIHVAPIGDGRGHVPSRRCWCGPIPYDDPDPGPDDPPIYVHVADDAGRRPVRARGEGLPCNLWTCTVVDDDDDTEHA
jgi:hypothetical protein